MNKTIIIAAVIGGLIVVTVGGRDVWEYIQGTQKIAKEKIKESIPVPLEIARIESMIQNIDKTISLHRERVIEATVDTEMLEEEIHFLKKRLNEDKQLLEEAASLLQQDNDDYRIGDVVYTRTEVDNDAKDKFDKFKQDEQLLTIKKVTLETLRKSIEDSSREIRQAEITRRELSNNSDMLQVRYDRYSTQKELAISNF